MSGKHWFCAFILKQEFHLCIFYYVASSLCELYLLRWLVIYKVFEKGLWYMFALYLHILWVFFLSADSSVWACTTVKINNINCMQTIWLISTNTRFLSFFLSHAPSFILLLYCTFEIKSHNMKFAHFHTIFMPFVNAAAPLVFPGPCAPIRGLALSLSSRPSPHSSSYLLQQTHTGTNMGQL